MSEVKQDADREPVTHNLKINRQPFVDLATGAKTCEVRDCSDRDFRVGDSVELFMTETVTGKATESIVRKISHIQRGYGLPDGICVLSYELARCQQLADMTHQRDMLGKAIGDAALKAGIVREGIGLTGPQLMMLADDLADCSNASAARTVRMQSALEAILPFIPTTSAREGGASRHVANVVAADLVRDALAQSAPATDEQGAGS